MITLNGYNHTYRNQAGEKIPGVTAVLAVVAKPYLIPWANKLGLEGISIADYNKEVTGIGSLTHAYIEGKLKGEEVDDSMFPDAVKQSAKNCFGKFLDWYEVHDIKVIDIELSLSGERIGGTIDAILEIDGEKCIVDWKTSKDIYPEYWAQLSAYLGLFHYKVEQIFTLNDIHLIDKLAILQMPKESGKWKFITEDPRSKKIGDAYEYFQKCLDLYEAKKRFG